jgi:Golgi nucleoside diphosphatase
VQIEHLKAKGMKMTPGLSSFASRVEDVGEYLTPLFENAATVVPPEFQASTEVYVLGTAGKICNQLFHIICK